MISTVFMSTAHREADAVRHMRRFCGVLALVSGTIVGGVYVE
jgi:hypothetical protein